MAGALAATTLLSVTIVARRKLPAQRSTATPRTRQPRLRPVQRLRKLAWRARPPAMTRPGEATAGYVGLGAGLLGLIAGVVALLRTRKAKS